MVWNSGLTLVARSYRQYSKHHCKLLCERDISRLTTVKKMQLSIPKTDSVNVALDGHTPLTNYSSSKKLYLYFFPCIYLVFFHIIQGWEESVDHCERRIRSRENCFSQICHALLCYGQWLCQRSQCGTKSSGIQPHHGGEFFLHH